MARPIEMEFDLAKRFVALAAVIVAATFGVAFLGNSGVTASVLSSLDISAALRVQSTRDTASISALRDGVPSLPRIQEQPLGHKIILTGGAVRSNFFDDVFVSLDGTNWNTIDQNDTPHWSPRFTHATVFFQNKVWVIGGCCNLWNEVWSSVDGKNWVEEVHVPNTKSSNGFAATVYQNKIYVMGGSNAEGGNGATNAVWSFDGKKWTQEKNAPWTPREWHYGIVYQNYLWVIGGIAPNGSEIKDKVWRFDGRNWQQYSNPPWDSSYEGTADVITDGGGEKIFIIGGAVNGYQSNSVWTFDGLSWEHLPNAPFEARFLHSSFVRDNKLYISGGRHSLKVGKYEEYKDVWSTLNGRIWQMESSSAPWGPRYGHSIVNVPDSFGSDIVITNVSWVQQPRAKIATDITFLTNITIKNNGVSAVTVPGKFTVSIMQSQSSTADNLKYAEVTADTSTILPPGGKYTFKNVKVVLSAKTAGKPFDFSVVADSTNVIDESNENNNTYNTSVKVLP